MAVVATNLIAGPADVYRGVFGATEPTDASIATAPATGTWTDMGGTQEGLTINVGQEFQELTVDQVIDRVESRRTSRSVTVGTSLAEPTLENFQWVLNGGVIATGAVFKSYEPEGGTSSSQPSYNAMIADGWAPMVANVAKSVDAYMRDNVSTEQAQDGLLSAQPSLFEADMQGAQFEAGAWQKASRFSNRRWSWPPL